MNKSPKPQTLSFQAVFGATKEIHWENVGVEEGVVESGMGPPAPDFPLQGAWDACSSPVVLRIPLRASCGNFLERQNLRPHPRTPESIHILTGSPGFVSTLKYENYSSGLLLTARISTISMLCLHNKGQARSVPTSPPGSPAMPERNGCIRVQIPQHWAVHFTLFPELPTGLNSVVLCGSWCTLSAAFPSLCHFPPSLPTFPVAPK